MRVLFVWLGYLLGFMLVLLMGCLRSHGVFLMAMCKSGDSLSLDEDLTPEMRLKLLQMKADLDEFGGCIKL